MLRSMDQPANTDKPNRADYCAPRLTRFGKIRELTASGTGAMEEGMGGGMGMGMGDGEDINRRS